MLTIAAYVIGLVLVVAVVFALVWFVFGRGEDLPPLEKGTTLTRLPRAGITGDDVRALVFQQVTRGYQAQEVDWALEKLARELDDLRAVVHDLTVRAEEDEAAADTGPLPEVDPSRRR